MSAVIEDLKRSQYLDIAKCDRFKAIKEELVANCGYLKEIGGKNVMKNVILGAFWL